MKWSFEVPMATLYTFLPDQDYIFSLSFLFQRLEYRTYIRRVQPSMEVILDNSYNELQEPDNPYYLAGLALGFGIRKIVCPDSDGWSIHMMKRSLLDILTYHPKSGVIMVVRNPKEVEAFSQYGITEFAVPYEYRASADVKCARPGFPAEYDFSGMHFLGLNSTEELKKYNPKSIDTSMPIKLAFQGKNIKDWEQDGYPHFHTQKEFFDQEISEKQIYLAKSNIKYLKEVIQ